MKPPSRSSASLPRALALGASLSLASSVSAQILRWNFDDPGVTAANSGSASGYILNLKTGANVAADLHGAAGSGVGGLGRALDLSGNPAFGAGAAPFGDVNTPIGALSALTVSGWFKTDGVSIFGTGGVTSTLFRNYGSNNGLQITTSSNNRLTLSLGNGSGNTTFNTATNNPILSSVGQWVFFAATYDGTSVRWYVGNESTSVAATGNVGTFAGPVTAATGQTIMIGRSNSGSGAFDGLLDDFRIYDSALDAAGVEAVRLSAVAIPEPSSWAALLGLTSLALVAVRRRRSRP